MKGYKLNATFRFAGRLPSNTELSTGKVSGTLGTEPVDMSSWVEPPHRRLANLPTVNTITGKRTTRPVSGITEERVIEEFIKKYGVLWARIWEDNRFIEDGVRFADAQDTLGKAWTGDGEAIADIEGQVRNALEVQPSIKRGGIELTTENLWSLICVLFLLDYKSGKTGVCGNPDCPAPYFLRKRKDQKYCERGSCSAYAQRQYALGWWKRKGYEIRSEKSKAKSAKGRKRL
jgi:hypothetical protein